MTALRYQWRNNSGAVRISLGLVSNFADAYRLMYFLESFRDQLVEDLGEVGIENFNCRILYESPID